MSGYSRWVRVVVGGLVALRSLRDEGTCSHNDQNPFCIRLALALGLGTMSVMSYARLLHLSGLLDSYLSRAADLQPSKSSFHISSLQIWACPIATFAFLSHQTIGTVIFYITELTNSCAFTAAATCHGITLLIGSAKPFSLAKVPRPRYTASISLSWGA